MSKFFNDFKFVSLIHSGRMLFFMSNFGFFYCCWKFFLFTFHILWSFLCVFDTLLSKLLSFVHFFSQIFLQLSTNFEETSRIVPENSSNSFLKKIEENFLSQEKKSTNFNSPPTNQNQHKSSKFPHELRNWALKLFPILIILTEEKKYEKFSSHANEKRERLLMCCKKWTKLSLILSDVCLSERQQHPGRWKLHLSERNDTTTHPN